MALCWVKAGECEEEPTIEARKISPTKMVFDITITCEHIQALAEAPGGGGRGQRDESTAERDSGLHPIPVNEIRSFSLYSPEV